MVEADPESKNQNSEFFPQIFIVDMNKLGFEKTINIYIVVSDCDVRKDDIKTNGIELTGKH